MAVSLGKFGGMVLAIVVLMAGYSFVFAPPAPGLAAKDTETPTPTADPGSIAKTPTATAGPTATPSPTIQVETPTPWIVIMVTATPIWPASPPSLTITDLDKKIKAKKGSAPGGLMLYSGLRVLAPPRAENPIPAEVDERISVFMAYLIERQLDYHYLAGRFAQMMPSHSSPPAEGDQTYPDGWFISPTDQRYDWAALAALRFEPLPFSATIDTSDGPNGTSFTACFRMIVDGQTWKRCSAYGPDASGRQDWAPEVTK